MSRGFQSLPEYFFTLFYWRVALYIRLTHPSSGLRAQSALL
nr:MAG TPA: hypothetical protein [Bacteriophage sp.]DAU82510.1 MAG TPA: hypothetical protein [Caudoviricetes sp.]